MSTYSLIITTDRPVLVHFIGERTLQLHQHVHLEFAVRVDLSLDLLVLGQRLLNAVLRVQLWVLSVVDVVEYFEWYVDVLHLVLDLVDLLQSSDQTVTVREDGKV